MIKAIIFDMYGVVMKDPTGRLTPYMETAMPGLSTEELYTHWIAASNGSFGSHEFFRRIGFDDPHRAEREYLDTIELDDGFIPEAERLRGMGMKLALLSNDISEWSLWLRQKYGLDRLFDAVAVSGDVGFTKPDARIFKLVSQRLDIAPEQCVYIDDRERFLTAAEALGMTAVLFNSRNVVYDGPSVRSFAELGRLLDGILEAENARQL